jgi:nitrite reductase/ring-hydroxylating ferredoxin subunit
MVDWRNLSNAPTRGETICPLESIGSGGREIVFGTGLNAFRMFVINLGAGEVRAYVNRCSHYSLPLNHRPDEFLTRDGKRIMCRQHLALFAIEDGTCIDGACEGAGLMPVPVHVDNGIVVIG